MDSQCKYAAIARGDASIYLRLPTRADYRERIWVCVRNLSRKAHPMENVTKIRTQSK